MIATAAHDHEHAIAACMATNPHHALRTMRRHGLDASAWTDPGLRKLVATLSVMPPDVTVEAYLVRHGRELDDLAFNLRSEARPATLDWHCEQLAAQARQRKMRERIAMAASMAEEDPEKAIRDIADYARDMDRDDGRALVNALAYLQTDAPAADPIVVGLFDRGDKIAVIGSSKSRKTFFSLQLAVSCASGSALFGNAVQLPRRVLLIQFEVKAAHFHRRARMMLNALDIDPAKIEDRLTVYNARGHTVNHADIVRLVNAHRADLVILDPLYKLLQGDENSAEDVKPILSMFDRISESTGAAVMFVHHNAKGHAGDRQTRDRGAGSGVIARDFDTAIYITDHADGEDRFVLETICRNYPPRPAITVEWDYDHDKGGGCFKERADVKAEVRTQANAAKTSANTLNMDEFEAWVARHKTFGAARDLKKQAEIDGYKWARAAIEQAISKAVEARWLVAKDGPRGSKILSYVQGGK